MASLRLHSALLVTILDHSYVCNKAETQFYSTPKLTRTNVPKSTNPEKMTNDKCCSSSQNNELNVKMKTSVQSFWTQEDWQSQTIHKNSIVEVGNPHDWWTQDCPPVGNPDIHPDNYFQEDRWSIRSIFPAVRFQHPLSEGCGDRLTKPNISVR